MKAFRIVGSIAVAFVIMQYAQYNFLGFVNKYSHISLFYLPAALVTFSVLMYPRLAPFGLFIGALFYNTFISPLAWLLGYIAMSAIQAVSAFLAVHGVAYFNQKIRDFIHPGVRWSDIDAVDVLYVCSVYSLLNSSLHSLLFASDVAYGESFSSVKMFSMFIGDLTGSFFVFLMLNLVVMFSLKGKALKESKRDPL